MQKFDLVKDADFLNKMRIAGKIAASLLELLEKKIEPGVTTNALDKFCHDYIVSKGAVPAPLGYKGFPKSICTSINHVVCHGIPSDKPLKKGDLLNVDVSLSKDGAFADTCKMYYVGEVSILAKRIAQCAQNSLYKAISGVCNGAKLRSIGKAIQQCTKEYGYSIVRDFCGHGIGKILHDEPHILHYDSNMYGDMCLETGMTFTIEPMINVGKSDVKILSDGWTAVTKDRSLSAQWEHTILVTKDGYEILTLREEENLDYIKSFLHNNSKTARLR